jgi:hypothetical protein
LQRAIPVSQQNLDPLVGAVSYEVDAAVMVDVAGLQVEVFVELRARGRISESAVAVVGGGFWPPAGPRRLFCDSDVGFRRRTDRL